MGGDEAPCAFGFMMISQVYLLAGVEAGVLSSWWIADPPTELILSLMRSEHIRGHLEGVGSGCKELAMTDRW